MTVSIFDVLATLPSGAPGGRLTPDEMQAYLKDHCGGDRDRLRNMRHALRDELYRDGGDQHMSTLIDSVFTDQTVRELRKKWIPYAKFNNATKRVVNELSTVYAEPARRQVGTEMPHASEVAAEGEPASAPAAPPPDNERYQKLLEQVHIDERMIEVGRLLNLHRALLVGFRVRQKPDGFREPTLDVATPANVRAILHPNDDSLVVGWLIKCEHRTARMQTERAAWTLWTDHESVKLTESFRVIGDSYQEHGLGVCPWVPVALGAPVAGFWPGFEGEDLISAHVSIWFQNILLLKESKSATKLTVVTSDGTAARGQAADSEGAIEAPEGTSISTTDMSMDLSMFTNVNDHVLNNVAHNYGMSPAIIQHQGVQSAEARELMMMPLKERRRQQQTPLRRFEFALACVMSAVCAVDLAEYAFSTDGWRMEFGESETPLAPMEEQVLFEKRRAAGLDNSKAFLCRKYPGLSPDGAWAMITNNVLVETDRNLLMRPLMQISGSLGASTPDPETDAADLADPPIHEETPDYNTIAGELLNAS